MSVQLKRRVCLELLYRANIGARTKRTSSAKQNNIYLQKDQAGEQFILVECVAVDYIYPLIVRCFVKNKKRVKKKLLQFQKQVYEALGQTLPGDLHNTYHDPKSRIEWIRRYYQLKI